MHTIFQRVKHKRLISKIKESVLKLANNCGKRGPFLINQKGELKNKRMLKGPKISTRIKKKKKKKRDQLLRRMIPPPET